LCNCGIVLTGETEILGEKNYRSCVINEWMSMEELLNGID